MARLFGGYHDPAHDWIRLVAPFVVVIALFFAYYYGRQYVNRLVRLGEVGYDKDKETSTNKKTKSRVQADNEAEDEYQSLLNPNHNDDRPIVGKTDRYEWTQTNEEIEVYIPLSKYGDSISSREVNVTIGTYKFSVVVRREVIFTEEFSHAVKVDDSCWMIDNNTIGDPHIWLTLTKSQPTVRNQHWKSLFKGGPEINVGKLGPPVHAFDVNDKDSIRNAMKSVSIFHQLNIFISYFYMIVA